jgi:transcriptional regulator
LSTKIKVKDKEIAWRRSKIIELKAIGLNQAEIARELKVTDGTISLDMQYLREQAKQCIKEYITDSLPQQYQVCLYALDTILKHAYEILQEAHDNREKVSALELFKDTHMTTLELLSNATTIDSALEYIRNKQPQQQKKANEDTSDSNSQLTANASAAGKQSVF